LSSGFAALKRSRGDQLAKGSNSGTKSTSLMGHPTLIVAVGAEVHPRMAISAEEVWLTGNLLVCQGSLPWVDHLVQIIMAWVKIGADRMTFAWCLKGWLRPCNGISKSKTTCQRSFKKTRLCKVTRRHLHTNYDRGQWRLELCINLQLSANQLGRQNDMFSEATQVVEGDLIRRCVCINPLQYT
jgi:hypothetical protein